MLAIGFNFSAFAAQNDEAGDGIICSGEQGKSAQTATVKVEEADAVEN